MENELYKELPDPVLDAVAKLVSFECREWIGSPSELAEEMASNALTKYLNVKAGCWRNIMLAMKIRPNIPVVK